MTKMVMHRKSDVFLFTQKSTHSYLREVSLDEEIIELGCLKDELLYAAFSPEKSEKSKKLSLEFTKFMKKAHRTGLIERIMNRYGFKDWKSH